MKNITVIGSSYVGLTTGAWLADIGNRVVCLDIDEAKIAGLQQGVIPIHEPGLQEVVVRNAEAERLSFTTSYAKALAEAEFVFIAVGTPDDGNGGADLTQVRAAARSIAEGMDHELVVVNKSTVPIGTADLVSNIISEYRRSDVPFSVVSNPEFLREGSALADCAQPDRIVLGASDLSSAEKVAELYSSLLCPIIITDLRTAEMIKYASNAFLATRISFINEIAAVCEQLGADVQEVARGMGYDKRIGSAVLSAGLGFGGSCFPKDVRALMRMAEDAGQHPQMLRAVMDINADRRRWAVNRLKDRLGELNGKRVALLGLAFKPETDDLREAPSIDLIRLLRAEGAEVWAYDPAAERSGDEILTAVTLAKDAYAATEGADAVVLVTEWNEFKALDMGAIRRRMRGRVFVDGRNLYDGQEMSNLGFDYVGVGRAPTSRGGRERGSLDPEKGSPMPQVEESRGLL